MIAIKKILCPTDFSESAEHALDYAVTLARTLGAELVLLNVLQPITFGVGVEGIEIEESDRMLRQMEARNSEKLHSLADKVRLENVTVAEHVATGAPFVEILSKAKQIEADLIVMGTHGRTGLSHILIGSVAERVVRKAPCPVLTVKRPGQNFEMP